ncbi:acetyltransferase (GNAT) family protein [Kribbella sp. VKM Ac-2571]|uniref:GNAT family N-acetyltransferase n=1 Tax=Kribbella sp. VKM Ac-2571 TaxID=2512222 RepID=UPI00105D5D72|nr:GNAT family N-acetyltransferase [Kribbella sp. VKM Ac-2571]TDO62710.1 acetyltransferase (GNAT) family protein [Kribbella sp. VKM Ac-2571]
MPVSRHRLPSGRILEISTVADRPDLAHADIDVGDWPAFMRHNRVSEAYFAQTVETFADTCLIATSDGKPVGDAHAVQLSDGNFPAGGWEQSVVRAFADIRRGVPPDTACALNISVARNFQGEGVASLLLTALREAAAGLGLNALDAPVRPTHKHLEPSVEMDDYAFRTRPDGLPLDPWLRTHVRTGGRIAGVAPASWVISGSLAEWRSWTGLPFDRSGPVEVPGALVPVECDVVADRAVYVEPNVWVRHEFSTD